MKIYKALICTFNCCTGSTAAATAMSRVETEPGERNDVEPQRGREGKSNTQLGDVQERRLKVKRSA